MSAKQDDVSVTPAPECKMSGVSGLQYFDADVLALREIWSRCAVANPYAWERDGPNGVTDSAPFDMKDKQSGLRGKAKPGFVKPDVSRAAHEKIASDLAALLDLPVPPVTLFKITGELPPDPQSKAAGDPFVSISAWAFPSCDEWRVHASVITEEEKASAIIPLSAVWVFDCWISAEDRSYTKHILVAPSGKPPLKIACVDYAFSLSRSWSSGGPCGASNWEMPFEVAKRDASSVKFVADKISGISNSAIEEIVKRVEPGWLLEERRALILKNLPERRDRIHEIVGIPRP